MKCAERRAARRVTSLLLSLLWSLTLAGTLSAKSETVKMTIAGGDLARPVEVTESWILAKVNIWVGPGNTLNGVPDTRDGFVMWSEGAIAGPAKALPQYEVSIYGRSPEERILYVILFRYDSAARQGYVYLPGKGEKWYDVNVRTITRGVEGHWFRASPDFDNVFEHLIPKP